MEKVGGKAGWGGWWGLIRVGRGLGIMGCGKGRGGVGEGGRSRVRVDKGVEGG